jgi:hypothetical protein
LVVAGSLISGALDRHRHAQEVARAKTELDQRLDRIIQALPEPPPAPEAASKEDLLAAYPYGAKGARSIEGTQAPPAAQVRFELVGRMGCGPEIPGICLKYNYGDGAGFQGWMLVHKDSTTGHWVRALDLGMPFPLRPPVTSPEKRSTDPRKPSHDGKAKKKR